MRSSGKPNPIITLGTFKCWSNSPTIGIDPPERMYTVSRPNTSLIAEAAVRMKRLSGFTREAGAE